MQKKRNSERQKERNSNSCCSSLFNRKKQKQHPEKVNETLSKSSTNRSKNDITKNSYKDSQSGKVDYNHVPSQNTTKIINKQVNCIINTPHDITSDKKPQNTVDQSDNKNEMINQHDVVINNENDNSNSNVHINISLKNSTEHVNDDRYKDMEKFKEETNINDINNNNNNNTPLTKRDLLNEEENNFKSKKRESHSLHNNHPHSTCEIKSIKTNSNNINSIGHKKAITDQCEVLNKDKQSNYSSNNKSTKNNAQSSFYNQQQHQLQQQLQQITLNNKQLNHSCINNNKPTNINHSIPTMQSSKHLYNSTAIGVKGEHIAFSPQDFLSKNISNSTNHNNNYKKHIVNTTTNIPINTLPKHESNNSSMNKTEPKTTHKDVQLNYLTNSPTQSIKKILKETDTEEFYNLSEGEDEHSIKANPNEIDNSICNDNVSLISSHVLGTKSMADINDRLSVYSRSICGSKMFPNDNESVLYDLEQRQTQAIQEKINRNDIEIKKYTEKIQKLKEQILHCEELTKNYLRFIEKEERISDELRIMINYLHLHRETNKL